MDLHYIVNPTMEPLELGFFLPSLPAGFHAVRHAVALPTSGNFKEDHYNEILRRRTTAIIREIGKNTDGGVMVWSDVDVVFLGDSAPGLIQQAMSGFDLLFQKERAHFEDDACNFGFQVIRRNDSNLRFYQTLLDAQTGSLQSDDQSLGNDLLGSHNAPRWGHLPLSFAAESNGGCKRDSVLYHANLTMTNSQDRKRQQLTAALEMARDPANQELPTNPTTSTEPEEIRGILASLKETLQAFLDSNDGEEFLWLIDEAVWGENQLLDNLLEDFESCRADLLATNVRASFEDKTWNWWKGVAAPRGTIVARGENMMAALLPLVRFSRPAARVVIDGLDAGWRGHYEALVPTLMRQHGLVIEDIGGTGSFTPHDRVGLWYDARTWHWQGPVEHVPGKLHFPVPLQSKPLASGRLEDAPSQAGDGGWKILYVSPVGAASAELLPGVLDDFLSAGADCWLLQYDQGELPVPEGVRVIRDRGYKWQLAFRHLHPDAVAEYDYIFFWDDDLGVQDFDPLRFARIMRANRLDMAQPAIRSPHKLSHSITQHRPRPLLWRDPGGPQVAGRLTNFVEIMAPVFSRSAWCEFYGYLDPKNESGWGYDYIPLGRKGIVDVMPVVHTRAVQSITAASEAESRSFLGTQGLMRHNSVEMGWLFERPVG